MKYESKIKPYFLDENSAEFKRAMDLNTPFKPSKPSKELYKTIKDIKRIELAEEKLRNDSN